MNELCLRRLSHVLNESAMSLYLSDSFTQSRCYPWTSVYREIVTRMYIDMYMHIRMCIPYTCLYIYMYIYTYRTREKVCGQ